jgi:hypothetical protein
VALPPDGCQIALQRALARLVTDPDFRDRVRAEGEAPLPNDLSPLERERLLAAAVAPGMDITRMLHKGFRLGKLRALLPLTCALLGDTRLSREVTHFWAARPATSFYYLDEAAAFCAYLRRRQGGGLRVAFLADVIAYEEAGLRLQGHARQSRVRVGLRCR